MTRDDAAQVVLKHLGESIPDIDTSTIDANQSMKEMGANSLDMVEIVSCSMRELRVKVPRAELNKLTNLDDLIDLLYRSVEEKAAQPA